MLSTEDVKEMAERVHAANAKWWIDLDTGEPLKRNLGELMMLCVSELAEALEGDRKDLMDDKLPHRKMFEVELADALIRTLDIIGGLYLDVVPQDEVGYYIPCGNTAESLLRLSSSYVAGYNALMQYRMSEAVWNLIAFAEQKGVDILGAYEEKMTYNAVRADHSIEQRKLAGGKKY